MQVLFEFKLGKMTMEEYERKFLEVLRYGFHLEQEGENLEVLEWVSIILQR
jgi:hypothetical protein